MTDTDNTYNNIEELLPRFCEGMTTAAESRLVEEWIEQDESHRKIMNQIHALYLATDTLHVMKSVDTEKAIMKVKVRMNKKRISWWEWTQRIAAMLSIPLLIAVLWMYQDKDEQQEVAQMVEIKTNPGMTTSVELPDGTEVVLNSSSSLLYPSRFAYDKREVKLVVEAFFSVAKDEK